jgi:YD repeat-containing protein
MIRLKDKYGYKVDVVYEKGVVKTIKDSMGKQLYFEWYTGTPSKVKHVWSANDKKVKYTFEGDQLVQTVDVGGNTFKYDYDNAFNNLSKVTYDNKESLEIDYDVKKGFATKIKSRDGEITKYIYGADKKNPDLHYWTEVKKKGFDGKWRANKYEYEIRKRKDGSNYTYRIYTNLSGRETDTVYSECCGLPLKIAQGKHTTTFTYKDGLLTSKVSTKGEVVKLKYHDSLKKITYVKNNEGETFFKYSKKGDLKQAKNKTSQVNLFYDRKGRIKKMINADRVSKKKQVLEFKYNNQGKPINIAMGGIGSIQVDYDNYGEIKNVNSKEGHKMALKVTQAFQSLLAIVKPAGVNLNL